MNNLIFSLNATIPVFLVMVIGYGLKKCHLADASFVKSLNTINFKLTLPVLLFTDISAVDITGVWDTRYVLYCFFVTLICILTAWFVSSFLIHDRGLLGEFVQASYRSSAAILGIAFIQNIYGNAGMAPLMIIGTVPLYNIAAVFILSLTDPANSHLDRAALRKTLIGVLTNPIIWGILLGMLSSLLHITYPVIIQKTLSNIAVLATPLALLGLGAGFEGRKALALIKPTIFCTIAKLMVWPALFLPLAVWMDFRDDKLVALLIMLGSPTTVSCYIMARNMGHDGVLTSSAVVATTCVSSVTITLWLFILRSKGLI